MWRAENATKNITICTQSKKTMAEMLNVKYRMVVSDTIINGFKVTYETDYVYMLVTNDIYEHPLYVSDDLNDFCEKTNINKNTVLSQINHGFNSLQSDKKHKVIRIRK